MIISVPSVALGTSKEVLANMRRWCSHPSETVPTTPVNTESIQIERIRTRGDTSPKEHVRLARFYIALMSRECSPEKRVSIVSQVIDANGDAWWIPFLFTTFSAPVLVPVRQKLLDNCRRHWSYVNTFGPIFTGDTDCTVFAPFAGSVSPDEPPRWLESTSASTDPPHT